MCRYYEVFFFPAKNVDGGELEKLVAKPKCKSKVQRAHSQELVELREDSGDKPGPSTSEPTRRNLWSYVKTVAISLG